MATHRIVPVDSSILSRRRFAAGALGAFGALFAGAACSRERPDRVLDGHSALPAKQLPSSYGSAYGQDSSLASYDTERVCSITEDNIEGPFYKAGAPERAVLADNRTPGTPLSFSGHLLSASCAPLTGGIIEIWHADHSGAYDSDGFHLRGSVVAAEDGSFHIQTIVPGHYLNGSQFRPAHLHLKMRAPGHRALTTQLYFDGDPYNAKDAFIRDSLIVGVDRSKSGWSIARDLVLAKA